MMQGTESNADQQAALVQAALMQQAIAAGQPDAEAYWLNTAHLPLQDGSAGTDMMSLPVTLPLVDPSGTMLPVPALIPVDGTDPNARKRKELLEKDEKDILKRLRMGDEDVLVQRSNVCIPMSLSEFSEKLCQEICLKDSSYRETYREQSERLKASVKTHPFHQVAMSLLKDYNQYEWLRIPGLTKSLMNLCTNTTGGIRSDLQALFFFEK